MGLAVCGVAAGLLNAGVAQAQPAGEADEKVGTNPFMCWTSGGGEGYNDPMMESTDEGKVFGKGTISGVTGHRDSVNYGWGSHEFEYAVDRGDYSTLGLDYKLEPSKDDRMLGYGADRDPLDVLDDEVKVVNAVGPRVVEYPVGALFSSLPELVDYTWYMDVVYPLLSNKDRSINDTMVADLGGVLGAPAADGWPPTGDLRSAPVWVDGQSNRTGVPWKSLAEYQNRRAVARPSAYKLQRVSVGFSDPENPAGGLFPDYVGLELDRQASDADLVSGTTTTLADGRRLVHGVHQLPSTEFKSSSRNHCSNTVCTGNSNTVGTPVIMEGHSVSVDINDQETAFNELAVADREVLYLDPREAGTKDAVSETQVSMEDLRHRGRSTTATRKGGVKGYSDLAMEDTHHDEIHASIDLSKEFRRSFSWNLKVPNLGKVNLLPFGRNPVTYSQYAGGVRDPSLNEPYQAGQVTSRELAHMGYRQPSVSRAFPLRDGEGLSPTMVVMNEEVSPAHIRWPVYLYDMAWYLYELPQDHNRDGAWLTWLSDEGGKRLVYSGYGQTAKDLTEEGWNANLPVCKVDGEVITQDNLVCAGNTEENDGKPWLGTKGLEEALVRGTAEDVYLPFDTFAEDDDGLLLRKSRLVKQGVESPVGGYADGVDLSKFVFVIREREAMGSRDAREGHNFKARYGVPGEHEAAANYLRGWRSRAIDPNRPYLMVLTFYEALDPSDNSMKEDRKRRYSIRAQDSSSALDDQEVLLPDRQIRRVICRVLVLPGGFSPAVQESKTVFESAFEWIEKQMKKVGEGWVKIMAGATRAVIKFPNWLVQQNARLACAGLHKVDEVTALPSSAVIGRAAHARVAATGELRIIDAVRSRVEGIESCKRISTPAVPTCSTETDFIVDNECVELPQMNLKVHDAKYMRLENPVDYRLFGVQHRERWSGDDLGELGEGEDEVLVVESVGIPSGVSGMDSRVVSWNDKFYQVESNDAALLNVTHWTQMGLTQVYLEWGYRWADVSPKVDRSIDGFVVYVQPDYKSWPRRGEKYAYRYFLPKYVVEQVGTSEDQEDATGYLRSLRGFNVGSLGYDAEGKDTKRGHALVRDYHGPVRVRGAARVGGVDDEVPAFNHLLRNMPLAPGFRHGFQVAPYVGDPEGRYVEGPVSDMLYVDGGKAACLEREGPDGTFPAGLEAVRELYDCGGAEVSRDVGMVEDGFRVGLLGLTGTDLCYDIFSSTPAGLTWDNDAVRQVWGLVWILAGGVLFTLLVWQGLKMTYDMWLEPQPAIGLRQLVPRFFLAVILGAGSLFICQVVLTLASDLTCFVAQMTGMSMWGVVGSTLGTMVDGFGVWNEGILRFVDEMHFGQLLLAGVKILAMAFVVLLIFLFLIILFFKVMVAMLIRVALLAVLVALSPLAFAFFASDATAHWTKKWVSLFLGTTFQQVVVLIVIYLGGQLLATYMGSGADDGLSTMLTGMLLALMSLFVADRVPAIVNPGGQGMFQGFGQALGMAAAGAVTVATMGMGAAYGLGAAGVGMARGGIGAMRGGDDGGASATIPGGGGGAGGGGGGSPSTPPVVSPQTPGSFGTGAGGGVGGQAPGAGGRTGTLGRAWGAGVGAGQTGLRAAGYVPSQVLSGMRSGARRGTGFNSRMRDHLTGSSLFRGGSRSDDAARAMQDMGRSQARQGEAAQEQSAEMIQLLRQLNQRGP